MMIDESGLTWRQDRIERGPSGEACIVYACLDHPRLFKLAQRARPDATLIESFHIAGLPQIYRTAREAVDAMRANP